MHNDVGLYNRLTVFHEFHVLYKTSNDSVMAGSTSGVQISASVTSQKAVMQAFSIINCPAEPHFLPVLVKIKKVFCKTSQPRLHGNPC